MIFNVVMAGKKDEYYSLLVHTNSGANVMVTNNKETFTKTANSRGAAAFCVYPDIWTVTCASDWLSQTSTISINEDGTLDMLVNFIPKFTYTGTYEIVDDNNNIITTSQDNWKIRFLTSGTLTFTELNGAENGIDVFLVGGGGKGGKGYASNAGYDADQDATRWNGYGGGGGGGGYRTTARAVPVGLNDYYITVGGQSEASSGFNYSASGGSAGGDASSGYGGSGGAGGSSGGTGSKYTWGAENGANGGYEFDEGTGIRYGAGGGGGGGCESNYTYGGGGTGGKDGAGNADTAAIANSGGGGGGGTGVGYPDGTSRVSDGGAGGSGIVIIRNARQ